MMTSGQNGENFPDISDMSQHAQTTFLICCYVAVMATERKVPKEWRMGMIVPIWKRKGDVHDPRKYRGITLLSQVLKRLGRVLDARLSGEE